MTAKSANRWTLRSTSSFLSYNEGPNILPTLGLLAREVKTPTRVLICYDSEDDDTLPAVRDNPGVYAGIDVRFVRNASRGAHGAVMAGFAASMVSGSAAMNSRLLLLVTVGISVSPLRTGSPGSARWSWTAIEPLSLAMKNSWLLARSGPCPTRTSVSCAAPPTSVAELPPAAIELSSSTDCSPDPK